MCSRPLDDAEPCSCSLCFDSAELVFDTSPGVEVMVGNRAQNGRTKSNKPRKKRGLIMLKEFKYYEGPRKNAV